MWYQCPKSLGLIVLIISTLIATVKANADIPLVSIKPIHSNFLEPHYGSIAKFPDAKSNLIGPPQDEEFDRIFTRVMKEVFTFPRRNQAEDGQFTGLVRTKRRSSNKESKQSSLPNKLGTSLGSFVSSAFMETWQLFKDLAKNIVKDLWKAIGRFLRGLFQTTPLSFALPLVDTIF